MLGAAHSRAQRVPCGNESIAPWRGATQPRAGAPARPASCIRPTLRHFGMSADPLDPMTTTTAQPVGTSISARTRRFLSACGAGLSSTAAHAPENAAYGLMAIGALARPSARWRWGWRCSASRSPAPSPRCRRRAAGRRRGRGARAAHRRAGRRAGEAAAGQRADAPGLPRAGGLGLAGAGVLQVLYGMLRVGALVKFTPYPVRAGLGDGRRHAAHRRRGARDGGPRLRGRLAGSRSRCSRGPRWSGSWRSASQPPPRAAAPPCRRCCSAW